MIDYKQCYDGRPYHNLDHLKQVSDALGSVAQVNARQSLAIVYHDIVCDPTSKMNEELSAAVASYYHPEHSEFLTYTILATKSHKSTGEREVDLFLDADMSILASSEQDYNNYAKAIRKEYCMYPDDVFVPARKKFLESFRGFITPEFKVYEEVALANIERELRCL